MPSLTRSKPRREALDWKSARERLARSLQDDSQIDPEQRDRILTERARTLARKSTTLATTSATRSAQEVELVQFRWAREQYAIAAEFVHLVIKPCDLTRLPGAPTHLRGVTNLRGEILPVFDLREWFEVDRVPRSDTSRWLVLGTDLPELCLLTDEIDEIFALDPRTLHRAESDSRHGHDLVQGVTSDARTVLDGAAILAHPELVIGDEPNARPEVVS
jgi:purine-binding chemotaxis protein CheW